MKQRKHYQEDFHKPGMLALMQEAYLFPERFRILNKRPPQEYPLSPPAKPTSTPTPAKS